MRRGQARGQLLEPIARWEKGADGEILLLDPTAMRIHFKIDGRTVRNYEAVACDVRTRAPLYHEREIAELRAGVRRRARRKTPHP